MFFACLFVSRLCVPGPPSMYMFVYSDVQVFILLVLYLLLVICLSAVHCLSLFQ